MKWIVLGFLLISNCGFWLFCFNQINATGLHRNYIKKIEKVFVLLCFLIPLLIGLIEFQAINDWLSSDAFAWFPYDAPLFQYYGAWCTGSGFVLGVLWCESRFWLLPPKHLLHEEHQDHYVHAALQGGSPGTPFTHFLHSLPGNEICQLRVTKKRLKLGRAVVGLEQLRIGHLSDLHFTGQLRKDHYRFVFDRLLELEPNIIFVAGDIIDYEQCLPWINELMQPLTAEHGVYFVLGNHDRRIKDQSDLLKRLTDAGLMDLGAQDHIVRLASGTQITLLGNELPWYQRHAPNSAAHSRLPRSDYSYSNLPSPKGEPQGSQELRIGLSHSPDQLPWARHNAIDLMMAGHTHGGQVRIPGLGPLVSPSHQGSRFASGVFFRPPTLMHVSRGVAGTHPLRWKAVCGA